MPSLIPPTNLPDGLWWYGAWIAILLLLLKLQSPNGEQQDREKAEDLVSGRLNGFNEWLMKLAQTSGPLRGPCKSRQDLTDLLDAASTAASPWVHYDEARNWRRRGQLDCIIGTIVGLVMAGLFDMSTSTMDESSGIVQQLSLVFALLSIASGISCTVLVAHHTAALGKKR